jgi:outer membrane protein TolC
MSTHRPGIPLAARCAVVLLAGCARPFGGGHEEQRFLQQAVSDALERELLNLPPGQEPRLTTQPQGMVEAELAGRREELDRMGPDPPGQGPLRVDPELLGPDLTGATQAVHALQLRDLIRTTVQNNLPLQVARLQPAINETDITAAEAVFDAVLFGNMSHSKVDEPQAQPILFGMPLGTPFTVNDTFRYDTGLTSRLTTGGAVTISTEFTNFNNGTPGFEFSPDPAYSAGLRLSLSQPLLRGFGTQVNRAPIELARSATNRAVYQLRAQALERVAEAETAFWNLALAWHDLHIREWLVDVGTAVREVSARRRHLDTTLAQYSDAVARVEERKANLVRARRRVRDASDAIKMLMNDPVASVGSELVLTPLDELLSAPVTYALRDAIVTAVERRPEVAAAALLIEDASIRELLADNQRLPLLNLQAELSAHGLGGGYGRAYSEMTDADFVDSLLGLSLEVPMGNRAAEAGWRRARLERSAAVISYRQAVQGVVAEVKSALRDVVSDYELIQATRAFRVAQAENLRALLAEEQTLASLTPEFLNLKFQKQESLALARLEEVAALVSYAQSVAALHRAMGTGLEMNQIDLSVVDEGHGAAHP